MSKSNNNPEVKSNCKLYLQHYIIEISKNMASEISLSCLIQSEHLIFILSFCDDHYF